MCPGNCFDYSMFRVNSERWKSCGSSESQWVGALDHWRIVAGAKGVVSFAPAELAVFEDFFPRLAPWAVFFRRFAAADFFRAEALRYRTDAALKRPSFMSYRHELWADDDFVGRSRELEAKSAG